MINPLVQLLVLVSMTHGFRAVGRWVGPRRGGLLMGLPSTTALVLVGCGLERGIDDAARAAESCLLGLVATAALPLAYAGVAAAGWRFPVAAGAAVGGYVAIAAGLWWLPEMGPVGCALVAAAGVTAACRLARRVRVDAAVGAGRGRPLSISSQFLVRTATPIGYVAMIRLVRGLAGAGFAGRFVTFPGGSLAVLVTTHLEAGPETACKMAAAMPSGGLGMLAFLTAFRFGSPSLGLAWGTTAAFLAAFSALAVVGAVTGRTNPETVRRGPARASKVFSKRRVHPAHLGGRPPRFRAGASHGGRVSRRRRRNRVFRGRGRRPRRRRFSPRVETLAG